MRQLEARKNHQGSSRKSCETHLLVRGQTGDGSYAIPAGTLDGDPKLNIIGHMYTLELVSWYQIDDDLPHFSCWPPGYGLSAANIE